MPAVELPIFPLGLVLFPGAPQLLHIFEPRYRQMLADCLEGDRRFGVSFAPGGDEPAGPPAPGHVGCTALIRESRLLPDGRSNILTIGESRYQLREYLTTTLPYRVARVEPFDDDDPDADAPPLDEATASLRAQFTQFVDGMRALTDRSGDQIELADDPKMLSFQVSATLEVDDTVKLELLGLRSTLGRIEILNRMLRPLNGELAGRVAVHTRARSNGKGGVARDIVRTQ
jgi:Lon protease-like protein